MATTESITTTYAGESAGKYISAALLQNDSIRNGALSVIPNVKYKQVVNTMALSGIQADATCDFTDVGTVTVAERIIQPKSLQVNLKLCKANYRDTWEAIQMGYSAHDNLPPKFSDYLLGLAIAQVASEVETNIWSGVEATDGEFGGLEVKLAANAAQPAGQEVAGTTVTSSNVVAELGKVLAATPNAIYKKPGFSIRIPVGIEKAYIAAQAALGYMDKFHVDKTSLNFQGVPLIVCPGMSDNVMVATYDDNLWFGTGLLSDQNLVKLIDTSETLGDENVRIVMRYTAGTQFGIGADIVTYGITNASN